MQKKRVFLVLLLSLLVFSSPLMATGAKEKLEEEQKLEVASLDNAESTTATVTYATIDKTDLIQSFNYAYGYMITSSLLEDGVSINGSYWLRGIDDATNFVNVETFLVDTADIQNIINEYYTSFYQAGLKEDVGPLLTEEELDALLPPETLCEKFSYAYSLIFTSQLIYMNGLDILANEFKQGATDALYNSENRQMTEEECNEAITNYANKLNEEYEAYVKQLSEENLKAAEEFLEEKKNSEGIIVLPSGDLMEIISEDETLGATPKDTDSVIVDYELYLLDGTLVDSGDDVTFSLSSLIPGFVEAVTNLKVGQECYVYIHPDYGYGTQESDTIPPNSLLEFRIYLKGIVENDVSATE